MCKKYYTRLNGFLEMHDCLEVYCIWSCSKCIRWLFTQVWDHVLWECVQVLMGGCGSVWTDLFESTRQRRLKSDPVTKWRERILLDTLKHWLHTYIGDGRIIDSLGNDCLFYKKNLAMIVRVIMGSTMWYLKLHVKCWRALICLLDL
jgi:hypothetical protein